jgi:hypothetical protein
LIISIDAEKVFDVIQHHFRIKGLRKVGIEEMFFNILNTIYDKSKANIVLNREKLKPFPLKSRMVNESPLFQFLFNIVLEFLATALRQEELIKGI